MSYITLNSLENDSPMDNVNGNTIKITIKMYKQQSID